EHHVAWLLSLFGLAPIVLGRYERLHAAGTKVERGSIDILATSGDRKTLLLIACTMGASKLDEKAATTLHVAGILRREICQSTTIEILPVVVTVADDVPERFEAAGPPCQS